MRAKITAGALVILLLASGCNYKSRFTDHALEQRFRSNEADFNQLVRLFKEDPGLSLVNQRAAYVAYDSKANLPPSRFDNYKALLTRLNLTNISRGEKSGNFYLATWNKPDFIMGGSNEYFVYAEKPPADERYLANSMDDLRQQTDAYVFKKIADRWYLHVDNW